MLLQIQKVKKKNQLQIKQNLFTLIYNEQKIVVNTSLVIQLYILFKSKGDNTKKYFQ